MYRPEQDEESQQLSSHLVLPDLRVHTPRPLRHPPRVQETRTKGKNERKGVGGDLQSPSGFPCPPCSPSWHHTCCTFCLVSGIPSGHPRQEGAPHRACLLPGAASQELPRGGGRGRWAYPPGDTHTGGGARRGRLREALTAPSSLPGGPGFGRVLSSSLTWGSRQRSHSQDRAGKLSIKSTGGKPPRGHPSLGGRGPVCSGVLG